MVNTFQVACCPHNIIRKIPCKHRYFQVRNRLDPRELIIQILLLTYCKGANPMSSDIMSGSLGVQRPVSPIWGEFLLSCGSSRWYLSLRSSTRMLTFREGKKKESSKLHNRYFFEFQCYSNKSISVKDQYNKSYQYSFWWSSNCNCKLILSRYQS